jgi:hypothetical protein
MKQPAHYSLTEHIARFYRNNEPFITNEAKQREFEKHLKAVVAEHRAAELAEYERQIASEALARMV